jgi:hypothetical protein
MHEPPRHLLTNCNNLYRGCWRSDRAGRLRSWLHKALKPALFAKKKSKHASPETERERAYCSRVPPETGKGGRSSPPFVSTPAVAKDSVRVVPGCSARGCGECPCLSQAWTSLDHGRFFTELHPPSRPHAHPGAVVCRNRGLLPRRVWWVSSFVCHSISTIKTNQLGVEAPTPDRLSSSSPLRALWLETHDLFRFVSICA